MKPPSYLPGTGELTFVEINVIFAEAFWGAFDRKESQVINAEFSVALNDSFLIISRRMQNRTHVIKIIMFWRQKALGQEWNRCEEAVIGEEVMYLATISAGFVSGCQATMFIYNNISFFVLFSLSTEWRKISTNPPPFICITCVMSPFPKRRLKQTLMFSISLLLYAVYISVYYSLLFLEVNCLLHTTAYLLFNI